MAYKTADQIADLFFKNDGASRTDVEPMTKITWRTWKAYLMIKQTEWLMSVAQKGTGEYFSGTSGRTTARGTFKRGETLYFWSAVRPSKTGIAILEVSTKESEPAEEVRDERIAEVAFKTGYSDADDGGKPTPTCFGKQYAEDYMRGFNQKRAELEKVAE